VYGVSAVTAVTAQDTTGVSDVHPIPADIVRAQIDRVVEDVQVAAVKTGMLATADNVRAAVESLSRLKLRNVVVDPVLASGGHSARTLLAPDAVSLLKTRLLPFATVVTPNVAEAAALCGLEVDSLDAAREAARRIAGFGPQAVVIKGGHLDGPQAIDLLFHDGVFTEFAVSRVDFGVIHGTGCTFSSAIAAGLAHGCGVATAVNLAKRYVTGAIEQSFSIGHGARILNHFWDQPSSR
jgi:hydroxymethylpyrimidine kinase/phosphomethylpyrimidine kinase